MSKTAEQWMQFVREPIANAVFRTTLQSVMPKVHGTIALYDNTLNDFVARHTVLDPGRSASDHLLVVLENVDKAQKVKRAARDRLLMIDDARYTYETRFRDDMKHLDLVYNVMFEQAIAGEAQQQTQFRKRLDEAVESARRQAISADELRDIKAAVEALNAFKADRTMSPTSIRRYDTAIGELARLHVEGEGVVVEVTPPSTPQPPPQPIPPPSPQPPTETDEERKRREELETAGATAEIMDRELKIRRAEHLSVASDLFFRTVIVPYIYWVFGVNSYLLNDAYVPEVARPARQRLMAQLHVYPKFKVDGTIASRPSPEQLMQSLMTAMNVTNNMMSNATLASMSEFKLPKSATFMRELRTHFRNYETQYFFTDAQTRAVFYGRTFEREEFDNIANANFFNYFRHFWLPRNDEQRRWTHFVDDPVHQHRFRSYSRDAVESFSPLWMRFFERRIDIDMHQNFMNFVFDTPHDTIFIPFFHCVVTPAWRTSGQHDGDGNIFVRLGEHLRDVYVDRLHVKTADDIGAVRVLFSTHVFMVSQIMLLWLAGMRYVDIEKVLPEELASPEKLGLKATNEQTFFITHGLVQTIADTRFGTMRNELLMPGRTLPNKFGVRKFEDLIGHKLAPVQPVSTELYYFDQHPAKTADINTVLNDQQNTVFFVTTVADLLAMPKALTDEQFVYFIEASSQQQTAQIDVLTQLSASSSATEIASAEVVS